MTVYLPIAEMPVNVLVFLAMGGAVGFLSGMFGVGGGFLMTPLLIFSGIPAAVAIGTEAAQIVASSVSGAIAQYQRGNVDVKMGIVLLLGGMLGSVFGVELVKELRQLGQFEIFVALSYVIFLGIIGEYLGRLYSEAKGRPLYIVESRLGFEPDRTGNSPEDSHGNADE